MNATRTMPAMREANQDRGLTIDPLFVGVVLLLVYVALLIGAAVDYAASIDALALAGAGGM